MQNSMWEYGCIVLDDYVEDFFMDYCGLFLSGDLQSIEVLRIMSDY